MIGLACTISSGVGDGACTTAATGACSAGTGVSATGAGCSATTAGAGSVGWNASRALASASSTVGPC